MAISNTHANRPNVWLLDDEAELTTILKQACEDEYEMHVFRDPAKMISDFQTQRVPNVIITDINLPTWDGFSVIRLLKNLGFKGEVIYISGYIQTANFQSSNSTNNAIILEKPFSLTQFKEKLKIAVGQCEGKLSTNLPPSEPAMKVAHSEKPRPALDKIHPILQQRHLEDRKFLHDLSGPIFVISHVLQHFNDNFQMNIQEDRFEKQRRNFERAIASLEKMNKLHADQKILISKREYDDKLNMPA
jgi:CheY-like chemotaxis protein